MREIDVHGMLHSDAIIYVEDVILEDTIEEITGNVILKISPATSLEKKRNPNIQSILGIIVPNKDTSGSAQPNRTPEKHYTIVHNVLFKTTIGKKFRVLD